MEDVFNIWNYFKMIKTLLVLYGELKIKKTWRLFARKGCVYKFQYNCRLFLSAF